MSKPARARLCSRVVLCLAATLVLATSCRAEPSSKQAEQPPSVGHSTDPAATSSAAPTTPSDSPSASPTESVPSTPGPLLGAAELPGFNEEFRWRQGPTTPGEPAKPFGTCQRFALTSIGAERVVVRTFTPGVPGARNDRAGEQLATFPDSQTAKRAYSVLGSWRAKCEDKLLGFVRRDVGDLQPVQVEGGTADWYLLTYGPVRGAPDEQFFDAQGMTLVGNRIAMVTMVLAGQDYDYEPGQEPMVAALQRAAGKLG